MQDARSQRRDLLILYGSQTGEAQDVAERVGREAKRRHFNPRIMAMDAFPVNHLPQASSAIFICSTTGQGEVPSNMKTFWRFLLRKSLPADSLKAMQAAVFGLGDSGYQNYNTVAKKLDRRLAALGAAVVCERGLGDDQHPNGYEAALDPWLRKLWAQLRLVYPLQQGLSEPAPEDTTTRLDPKYRVRQLALHEVAQRPSYQHPQEEAVAAAFAFSQLEAALSGVPTAQADAEAISRQGMTASTSGTTANTKHAQYGLWKPFMAPLTCNQRVTAPDHFQDTRHLEFDLSGSGIQYNPGDLLAIFPQQSSAAVSAFLQRTGLDPDAWVSIEAADAAEGVKAQAIQVRVGALVQGVLDVAGASPRRYFFEVLQHFATSELEIDRLEYFATPEGRNDLYTYNQKEGRTVLEVLQDFKSAQPPLEWLLQTVPHLKPRQFSIASSQKKHPTSAHVLLAVVDYKTPFKRRKQGLCSSWLASLSPGQQQASPSATAPSQSATTKADMANPSAHQVHTAVSTADDINMAVPDEVDMAASTADGMSWHVLTAQDSSKAAQVGAKLRNHSVNCTHVAAPDALQHHTSNGAATLNSTKDSSMNGAAAVHNGIADQAPGMHEGSALRQEHQHPVVAIWTEHGVLHMPPSHSIPMVLIGPGTGVAPFKAFLEERQMAAAGASVAPSHLVFGCCNQQNDFYYSELWQQLVREGILSADHGLLTAFSRDQKQKIYVQDRLREQGDLLWEVLQQGAYTYVSGSAEKMPQAVATAFEDVAAAHSTGGVQKFVQNLEQLKRYAVEAWS